MNEAVYTNFVIARHRIWEQRQAGSPQPWTDDPILAHKKFTNVFRILDFGSQYVLTDLLVPGADERDDLMRLFLYRHTGRVETWQWLEVMMGMPNAEQIEEVRECWHQYRGRGERKVNNRGPYSQYEKLMFTKAYLVFPQSQTPGTDKLDSVLDLTKRLFTPGSHDDIMPAWSKAKNQADRFKILQSQRGVGDFMAMQILTDWGYSEHCGVDREDEFVQPGPGAIKGAKFLFPGQTPHTTIKWAQRALHEQPDCPMLGDRPPSLMDVQNTLCEYSKYHRVMGSPTSDTSLYKPAHPGPQPKPVLPDHWKGSPLI